MELKNNEASNIEKWTLEKLLMDQAMGDLNAQLEVHRKELSRLRAELGLPDEPLEEPQQYTEGGEEQGLDQHQQNDEQMEGVEGGEEQQQQQQQQQQQETNDEAIDPNLDPESTQAKEGLLDGAHGSESVPVEGTEIAEGLNDNKAFAAKDSKIHLREEEDDVKTTATAQEDGGDRAKRIRNA